MAEPDDDDATAPFKVWFGLCVCATLAFWSQATVTEERLVPALNFIADRFSIPDDVAGATLMAAGASSPELFSSIVALFVTHSALGLGTIVGSEIFNQLVICAGSVLASRSGRLKLDRAVVTREVGFYALSIVLLMVALSDTRPLDDDPDGPNHIFINLFDASLLFGGYVMYVLVCANFERIVALLSGRGGSKGLAAADKGPSYGAVSSDDESYMSKSKRVVIDLPKEEEVFLRPATREPEENFFVPGSRRDLLGKAAEERSAVSLYMTKDGGERSSSAPPASSGGDNVRQSFGEESSTRSSMRSYRASLLATSIRSIMNMFSEGASVRMFDFMADVEKPSDIRSIYDVELNSFEERTSCFLWQRSIFYNKARVAMNAWHLRWFSFTHDKVASVPDRKQYDNYTLVYPKFRGIEVDTKRTILKLVGSEGRRDYYLMAPSSQIFDEVVKRCEDLLKVWEDETKGKGIADTPATNIDVLSIEIEGNADDEPSLIDFPLGEPWIQVIIYLVLFPLKLLMHLTVPDVRHLSSKGDPTTSLLNAFLATISCLLWLIVGSYAMVASLEALAALLDIPDAVMGVTVSAAGTSLPNYVASQCAARQGFGNMAVSNAFGSNTFNILVGLGLPWLLYTAFATQGQPYHGLRDDGVTVSVTILSVVLLAFVVLILLSNFSLYKWHAYTFFAMYACYIIYAVGQVYLTGMTN